MHTDATRNGPARSTRNSTVAGTSWNEDSRRSRSSRPMKLRPYPVEPRTFGANTREPGRHQGLDQDGECRPLLAFRAAMQQHHGRQRPVGAVRAGTTDPGAATPSEDG